jgi:type IV secretion system protein TrbL
MDMTTALIDEITAAFLAALAAGGSNLGLYSLAILSLCATIAFYKEYGMVILHGTGLGDALAGLLVFAIGAIQYYWLMVNLFPMAQAALGIALHWGLAGTGGTSLSIDMLQKPSFIMIEGLKAAYPLAEQGSWLERIWGSLKMINKPGELVAYWVVVLAFLAITLHHMTMLIEYHLAVMCGAVLIPWGLWSATASIGEFAVGWLTGGFIRALVSTTMLGIALPLFGILNKPVAPDQFITVYNTVMLMGGSFIFAVLAWVIPARAAGIASRGMSLAIHGGAITGAAMTFARFGMMGHGAASVATRAHAHMMQARHATRPAA